MLGYIFCKNERRKECKLVGFWFGPIFGPKDFIVFHGILAH
jgi:hypothetical protein